MRRIVALVVLSIAPTLVRSANVETRPKLVVLLVVDQMRADYIDRFKGEWRGGFHRLLTDGAWFRQAAYPYLETVTCSGHATIATGAFPRTHGVMQNAWWGRAIVALENPTPWRDGHALPKFTARVSADYVVMRLGITVTTPTGPIANRWNPSHFHANVGIGWYPFRK